MAPSEKTQAAGEMGISMATAAEETGGSSSTQQRPGGARREAGF